MKKMDFSQQSSKRAPEQILPMINVVFLLLIFFLLSASFSHPLPQGFIVPTSAGQKAQATEYKVYITQAGQVTFQDTSASRAWENLSQISEPSMQILHLYADAQLSAQTLTQDIERLENIGFSNIELIVQ